MTIDYDVDKENLKLCCYFDKAQERGDQGKKNLERSPIDGSGTSPAL